jgi:calcineurin-binding protein cabin-1
LLQPTSTFKARTILLGVSGKIGDWGKYPYMPGPGLFAERKRMNLFNGIWRIPSNEVDRPGSFAAHMARSVNLLMNNAVYLDDFNTLIAMAVQLARKPEADKMYLYETERKHLSSQALEQVSNGDPRLKS